MKSKLMTLLCLALALSVCSCANAMEGMPKEGSMVYTLPESAAISLEENVSSYVITWEPIAGIHAYQMGLLLTMEADGENTFWYVLEGYVGAGDVEDGTGKKYRMENVNFDAIMLDGNATELDIAPQINKLVEMNTRTDFRALECFLLVLIIPESGHPMQQVIDIPLM